ncbi:MAG: MarR family transcriptional regulator [Ktedonobacteraceae bacterium]|nr:MarR family transcriptional regulator [Ktedonobacteraceae bacterium]
MPGLAVLAWMRLARVFQKVDRATADELRTWNLNTAQFDVLVRVGSSKGITQQELADRLLVTKGNISQLLDRMERLGLLQRRQDGRSKSLSLTDAGQKLYKEIVPLHEMMITQQFSVLSKEEVSQLLRLLRKLDHHT